MLPESVSGTVGDASLYPLQQQPGGAYLVEKAEGRKSKGISGKIVPRGQQQQRYLLAGLEEGNGGRGVSS